MKKNTYLLFYVLSGVLLFLFTACNGESKNQAVSQTEKITFMAGYKPQANLPFVGVYVAQEKKYFDEENIEVSIEHSPGQGAHLQLTAAGKVHVTTQDASILLQRRGDPGLPLVSIALIGQKGQQAYAALQSSGIHTIQDWAGHTIGYKGAPPPDLFALLDAAGLNKEKVQLVNVGFDPRLLTEGKVDIYPVFRSNEPFTIKKWGFDINTWAASDFGVPLLGLCYVSSDETVKNSKEALTRFLRAAIKGIRYARENPEAAVDIVMKYAGSSTDRELMKFMLESEIQDAETNLTGTKGIGWQTHDQWQNLASMLQKYNALKKSDVDGVYTTSILEDMYQDNLIQ